MQPNHSAAISGGFAAYLVIILGWLLGVWHIQMPAEVQAAIAGLLTAAVGYLPALFSSKPSKPGLSAIAAVADLTAQAARPIASMIALAFVLLAAAACTHDQVRSTLQNINSDAQIVGPIVDKVICLDAAGAVISGPLLAATGNDAGSVVGAAGSAIAKQACPPGASPSPAP